MTETNLSKTEIVDIISQEENFKSILDLYQTEKTQGFKIEFNNEYKNGLAEIIYGVTVNDNLIKIIMPIFSSEKTITWNFSYLKTLRSLLPKEYSDLQDHEIVNLIICPLYYLDKYTGEMIFLSVVNAKDWLEFGTKGKNGFSVYFWNDKLPNKYSLKKNILKSEIFVSLLPFYTVSELKKICLDYANKHYTLFHDSNERSSATIIKNIANGLYAQITIFLYLLKQGYDVSMDWLEKDDLGIDIKLKIHGVVLNIDVKSTKTSDLKISRNRKETDFYAVTTWDKKGNVILQGFLHKYKFWQSNILNTLAPTKVNDMYVKSLQELKPDITNINEMFTIYNKYKTNKMKLSTRLFNEE